MRAFRPSHFAREEDYNEDADRAKQDNIIMYARRAQAGLPLFGDTSDVQELSHTIRRLAASG